MAFDIRLEFSTMAQVSSFIKGLPQRFRRRATAKSIEWGMDLVEFGEQLSPEDKLRGIDTRRRASGERLAFQWQQEIDKGQDKIELNVGNVDPKAKFILFPTAGGATITPTSKDYLVFFGEGVFNSRFSVTKGATEGQPVHEWMLKAFDLDERVSDLADTLVRS